MKLLEFLHQSLLSGSTGCLHIFCDGQVGKLFLENGHLVHALCPSFLGEEALWSLLSQEPEEMEFEGNSRSEYVTITRPTELILMESAVHVDQPERRESSADRRMGSDAPPNYFRITTSVQFPGNSENSRKLYILSQGVTTVGRSNTCDLIIGDKTVSRRHAEFKVSADRVLLTDLKGRNGTRINDRQIQKGELQSNDTITFGTVTLRFYWSQNGEPVLVQEPLKSPVSSTPTGPIKLLPPR